MPDFIKSVKRFARNKKAISGLETAIVLIAFVIVASAFSYAVLNMGFLATQKAQQVVLGGLAGATAALVVDGPIFGYGVNDPIAAELSSQVNSNYTMHTIIFWIKLAAGADSVDLNVNKTTISYQNPRGVWPNIYNTGGNQLVYAVGKMYTFAGTHVNNGVGLSACTLVWEIGTGYMLKPNDKVRVTIDLTLLGMGQTYAPPYTTYQEFLAGQLVYDPWASNGLVLKNEQFTIIIKPPTGPVLDIVRVAPAGILPVNDLS